LKINDNFKKINVKKQTLEKDSILNFYKSLIQLKKSNKTLIYGDFKLIFENDNNIFAYTRSLDNEFFLIICNLTSFPHTISTNKFSNIPISILISNYSIKEINLKKIILNPYECILCKFYI
ncbi:alpha-glucosidase C-terminal domain-containing protein, partial [uncultured Cetobacterium sp.]